MKQYGSRRRFLRDTSVVTGITMIAGPVVLPGLLKARDDSNEERPWYRKTFRWGQTNINELDPKRYDIDWWREHWRKTHTQGLVINAGGIVAYYPSKFPMQYRAQFLEGRDLYGELTRAAHEDGLAVLARMDSNRAHEAFYRAHQDWFAVDADAKPYRAADRYVSCIDSPYYSEYLPQVLREIIAWEKPEGFTDNSWSGLSRNQICYCRHSQEAFRKTTGHDLPRKTDWTDPVYREWVEWSYARRLEIWDLNNRTTKEAGGRDCLWLGMLGGDLVSQGRRLRDVKAICERSEVVMLDDQGRDDELGFQENAEMGKRLHGLLGWDKIIPESMAQYQRSPVFRKSAASPEEAKMWMLSGFAGQIQPWWHHVGAYQWDRRQFKTALPVYQWHAKHEECLVNRKPVASIGVLYSQRNADFYGQERADERVALPYYGIIQGLVRARIPYLPIHIDNLERDAKALSAVILPNLSVLSDQQMQSVRRFVKAGGGLLATGESSLYDEHGLKRSDFGLADLFGVHEIGQTRGTLGSADTWSGEDHNYLRLIPDLGKDVYGPQAGHEPVRSANRHKVLEGFEETDILPFGGLLREVRTDSGVEVPVSYVPHFTPYPPEMSWMREPRTEIPAVVLNEPAKGRCAYLACDLDRRFMIDYLPDHGRLLENLVRWVSKDRIPLQVEGTGLIDFHLYKQTGRLILHLVNLSVAGSWRSPLHELIPVGPLKVKLQRSPELLGTTVKQLVAGATRKTKLEDDWILCTVDRVLDHEVLVFE